MIRRPQRQGPDAERESQARTAVRPGRLLLSLILSVAMVLSTVPAQAFAEAASGTSGDVEASGNEDGAEEFPAATPSKQTGNETGENPPSANPGNAGDEEPDSQNQNAPAEGRDDSTQVVSNEENGGNVGQPAATYDQTPVTFFCLRNGDSGQYRYTSSIDERDSLVASGWTLEGTAWQTPTSSETPVYALVDDATGAYTFTTSKDQYDASSLSKKGIAFYSAKSTDVPVYAVTDGGKGALYTTSKDEYDSVVASGKTGVGVAFYALAVGDAKATEAENKEDGEEQEQSQNAKPAPAFGEGEGEEPSDPATPQGEESETQTVEVTFDANGGHFGEDETKTTLTEEYSETDNVGTWGIQEPVKDGKIFAGWSYDRDGNDVLDIYTIKAKDAKSPLYAVWRDKVTVTYEAGAGTFYDGKTEHQSDYAADTMFNYWEYEHPSRSGYVFGGWSRSQNSTNRRDAIDFKLTGDATVYAVWIKAVTYTFNANGGTFNSGLETTTNDIGIGDAVYPNMSDPTKEDETFAGWSFSPDNNIDNVVVGNYSSILASEEGSHTLYAVWTSHATLTLDPNGGSFSDGSTDAKNKIYGKGMTLYHLDGDEIPSKDGCVFIGYSEAKDGDRDSIVLAGDAAQGYRVDGDKTLYAVWADRVTVTYDAGEGYFNQDVDKHQIQEFQGKGTHFSARVNSPVRNGYIFEGWSRKPNPTRREDAESFTLNEDTTVHAIWLRAVTYKFDANGGTFYNGSSKGECSIPIGDSVYWNGVDPEKAGKVFAGWSFSPDNDLNNVVAGNGAYRQASESDKDTTLYAVWIDPVTVTYDPQGGAFPDGSKEPLEKVRGKGTSIYGINYEETPTKDGSVFVGYAEKSDASRDDVVLNPNQSINYKVASDTTFYAVWAQKVTVTFDAGEGYFDDDVTHKTSQQDYATGDTFYPSANQPKRIGYVFKGWAVENQPTAENIKEFTLRTNVTVHPVWVKGVTYTFNPNGGQSYHSGGSWTNTVETGYSVTSSRGDPIKDGMVFAGWSFSSDNDPQKVVIGNNSYHQAITDDDGKTLYAVWVNPATITFDANGGEFIDGAGLKQASVDTTWGVGTTQYYVPYEAQNPQRDGYILLGYAKSRDATSSDLVIGGSYASDRHSYTVTGDETLYAVWVKKVMVTFDANGGTFKNETDTPTTRTMDFQEGTSVNPSFSDLSYEGHVFVGWGLKPEGPAVTDSYGGSQSYLVNQDVTLYAIWKDGATVTYDANGGTFGDGMTQMQDIVAKGAQVYNSNYEPQNDGKLFVGWAVKPNGGINDVVCGGIRQGDAYTVNTNVTLYAVWTDGVQITYNANGGTFSVTGTDKYIQRTIEGQPVNFSSYYPTRDHKVFVGWSTKPNPTKGDEQDLSTISAKDGLEFYAIWADSIDITFDANGGAFNYGNYAGKSSFTEGYRKGNVVWSNDSPSRNGYTFAGWAAKRDASVNDVIFGGYRRSGSYTAESKETLYAVWDEQISITFDANGGQLIGSGISGKSSTVKMGRNQTLGYFVNSGSISVYNRDSHKTFLGWATKADANDDDIVVPWYAYDSGYIPSDGDTFYAVWSDEGAVTVDANGGNFINSGNITTGYPSYTADGKISSLYPEPAKREGYEFIGWTTERNNASGTILGYDQDAKLDVTKNNTYYAFWSPSHTDGNFTYVDTPRANDSVFIGSSTSASGDLSIPGTYNNKKVTSIAANAFYGDQQLTSVKIPSGVTSIGHHAFGYCGQLSSVDIPASVTSFGEFCFGRLKQGSTITVQTQEQAAALEGNYDKNRTNVIVKQPVTKADKAALEKVCQQGDSLLRTGQGTNTTGSWDAFTSALSEAKKVLEKDYATQTQVDQAAKALSDAISGIKQRTDVAKLSVSVDRQGWTGEEVKPLPTVKDGDKVLVKGVDYTVSYKNNTDLGSNAVVVITGAGDYFGTKEQTFEIAGKSIEGATVSDIADQVYTGSQIRPSVTVKLGDVTLTKDTDYTVAYGSNVNAGSGSVTVIGKGNYAGTVTKSFKINPRDINDATIANIGDQTYNGSAFQPELKVTFGGKDLRAGEDGDFTVTYPDNTDVGTATVTINGVGNFTGSKSASFSIVAADLSQAEVSIPPQKYTGKEVKPDPKVILGGRELVKDIDYTVAYSNNINIGENATVTITAKGSNYKGSKFESFRIAQDSIEGAQVSGIPDSATYTGSEIKPEPTVTLDGRTLEAGKDYQVSYANNVDVGKNAEVTITGLGSYAGEIKMSFEITPKDISDKAANTVLTFDKSLTYTGKAIEPGVGVTVDGIKLVDKKDYKVEYASNTNVGTASLTITGTGNYTGGVKATFTITAADISKAKVQAISDQAYTGSAIEPGVTVTLGSKTLSKGTDYTVSYEGNTNVGTATVTVKGTGNYGGTLKGSFRITPADVSGAEVGGVARVYDRTGSEIEPEPTVTLNGRRLSEGADYTVSYEGNAEVGTATVTVRGTGNYAGSKDVKFEIRDASELRKAADEDAKVQRGSYTSASWDAFQKALSSARSVLGNADATQSQVDAALKSLNDARAGLKEKPAEPSKTSEPTAPAKQATKVMYRLYNPNSGEHFYTADQRERDKTVAAGWRYEGVGWIAPEHSNSPVYRLYSGTDHHYTVSASERDSLIAAGWSYEGVGWYSDDAHGVPLYRQFNPNVDPTAPRNNSGSHNYTTSKSENDSLVAAGWRAEGIGWYGVRQ